MAHGGKERALGPVGFVGALLGGANFVEQLASFTDVDPATDDALDIADGVTVRQDPVVNREFFPPIFRVRSRIIGLPSAITRW